MKIIFKELPNEMLDAFKWWHEDAHRDIMLHPNQINEFQKRIFPHIDKISGKENRNLQENYFNNFTLIWNIAENSQLSMDIIEVIWFAALDPIIKWEKENQIRIHKGSPYFYLGTSYIKNKNVDKGFIYLHEALKEDIRTHDEEIPHKKGELPSTPALATLTLNPTKYNFFRGWVIEIMDYLEEKYLKSFEKKYSVKFNFIDLNCKLLSKPQLINLTFLFTYLISRIYDIDRNKSIYDKTNNITTWAVTQIFRDILNTIEGLILEIDKNSSAYFSTHLDYFIENTDIFKLKGIQNKFSKFETSRKNDPSKAFSDLLSNNFKFTNEFNPNEMDINVTLANGLRNYISHNYEPLEEFNKYKYHIFKRLIHLLFAVVINFY